MKKIITTLALAATMVLGTASVALADGANCAGINGWKNHGTHITDNYVNDGDGTPGVRGRAAHFGATVGPGASFCQTHGSNQAQP